VIAVGIYCGIDWAEHHHDVVVVDQDGQVLARRRVSDDVAGFTDITGLLNRLEPGGRAGVRVALETDRGLFVHALVDAGYQVFAVNPKAVDRYRDRYRMSRAKSDSVDALVLANVLRTDLDRHRTIAADSDQAAAVSALARAHQDATRERRRQAARLRSQLREFYPAALQAFPDLTSRTAAAILSVAPTPRQAAELGHDEVRDLARACGRWGISHREVVRLHDVLHADQLHQAGPVEQAMGHAVLQIVLGLRVTSLTIARLEADLRDQLDRHPDASILRSLPGVGTILAARMLSEFGDDPTRFQNAASRRHYTGTAPITRASGRSKVVLMRRIHNTRLFDTCRDWSFSAVNRSPGARALYQQRRAAGDGHEAALRRVGNKLVGQLDHCLRHHEPYREETAWTLTA
jgi:transposase